MTITAHDGDVRLDMHPEAAHDLAHKLVVMAKMVEKAERKKP